MRVDEVELPLQRSGMQSATTAHFPEEGRGKWKRESDYPILRELCRAGGCTGGRQGCFSRHPSYTPAALNPNWVSVKELILSYHNLGM